MLGVVLARFFERRQRIELEIREKKVPVYQEMVKGLFDGLMNAKDGDTRRAGGAIQEVNPEPHHVGL